MSREAKTSVHTPTERSARRSWAHLALATSLAALVTWLLQAVIGRFLGPARYADFMVLWGFLFGIVGLLQGLQQEITRSVVAAATVPRRGSGVSVARIALGIGLGGGTLIVGTSPLWGGRTFGESWLGVTFAMAAASLLYAFYSVVNGGLSGLLLWTSFSGQIVLESLVRFGAVATAVALGGNLTVQAWALAAGGLTWMLTLPLGPTRAALAARGDSPARTLLRRVGHAMTATGCSALLVSGFPVLLVITTTEPLTDQAGILLAAVVATRAPLLLPLSAFQGVLLTRFVRHRERILRTLVRLCAAVAAVCLLGAIAAFVAGPFLLQVLYGEDYVISRAVIAVLVIAAGLVTMLSMTGSATMAAERHSLFTIGWLTATAVTVAVLTIHAPVEVRSCLALVLGPLAGIGVHVVPLAVRREPAPVTGEDREGGGKQRGPKVS